MSDNLIICPKCGGDACYETKHDTYTHYLCFGCGYTTNTFWNDENKVFEKIQETVPALYQEIRWKDEATKNYWYPNTVNLKTKGMVFADGKSKDDWRWASIPAELIPKKDKWKHPPNQTHKIDATKVKYFEQNEYMDALEHIGYFKI